MSDSDQAVPLPQDAAETTAAAVDSATAENDKADASNDSAEGEAPTTAEVSSNKRAQDENSTDDADGPAAKRVATEAADGQATSVDKTAVSSTAQATASASTGDAASDNKEGAKESEGSSETRPEQAPTSAATATEAQSTTNADAQLTSGPVTDESGQPVQVTVRCIVTSQEAGSIIGKGGATIRLMREQSHARIMVSNDRGSERVVTVIGLPDEITLAITLITQHLTQDGNMRLQLLVHNSQSGALIGRGGDNIRQIQETTGTQVSLGQQMPNSTDRQCTITGNQIAVCQAVHLIVTALQAIPVKGPTIQYKPGGQFGTMAGYGAGGGMRASRPVAVPGDAVRQLSIPNTLVGSIIGKGGSKINQIRAYSQADVSIADPQPGQAERIITIRGTEQGCDVATQLIQARVAETLASQGMMQPSAGYPGYNQ